MGKFSSFESAKKSQLAKFFGDEKKMESIVWAFESGNETTLSAIGNDKPLVVDFWNMRCTKCPSALSKLDALASRTNRVTFAACALALDPVDTHTHVGELIDEYPNLRHYYMQFEAKEALKRALNFQSLPFAVVFDVYGKIVWTGDPTKGNEFDAIVASYCGMPDVRDDL